MAQTYLGQKRLRKYYGKIREVLEMPNLIEVQKASYDLFLRSGDANVPTDGEGIQGVFQSVFPIKDFNETSVVEFVSYELEKPKYDVEECMQRDMTYSAPLKVTLRLIVFDVDEDTGAKSVKDIKEQDVFMGDMPLMTPNGTFVVNGTERVIVSQMHRSPGVFFDHDKGKPTLRASCCSLAGSSHTVGRGSTLNSMQKTSSLHVLTVVVSCLSPRCCMRWVWIKKASWMLTMKPSTSSLKRTRVGLPSSSHSGFVAHVRHTI
jgi:DNA-directed RNA polymerase beta subunit